jgi:hypothetical protein
VSNIPQHSICLQDYNPEKTTYASRWQKSKAKLSDDILTKVWSAVVFRHGKRRQADFSYADWLVLDFDSGELSIDQAAKNFCDTVHLIAPTRSHSESHHRFRVCLLFERRITDLETFRFNMDHYISRYNADNQCKDGARYYFPSQAIYSKANLASLFRVDVLTPPPHFEAETKIAPGEYSRFVRRLVGTTIPVGRRDVTTWAFARDLARAGFSVDQTKGFIKQHLRFESPFDFEAKVDVVYRQIGSENAKKEKERNSTKRIAPHGSAMDGLGRGPGEVAP